LKAGKPARNLETYLTRRVFQFKIGSSADAAGGLFFSGVGERLDRFLQQQWPALSRSRIQTMIRSAEVRLNGASAKTGATLSENDLIEVDEPILPEAQTLTPVALALNILFEDDALIVVNKPAGLSVHPGAGTKEPTLVEALLHHTGGRLANSVATDETGEDGDPATTLRPGIVHRLDKDTTGAIVVAKTEAAHRGLAAQFQARTNLRQYIGLLDGRMPEVETVVEGWLRRDPRHRTRFIAVSVGEGVTKRGVMQGEGDERPGLRWAKTLFRREKTYAGRLTLASMKLFTGRTHQIRVHAQAMGLPVVGDPAYAPSRPRLAKVAPQIVSVLEPVRRQLLHAWLLGFKHPLTGEDMRFEAPLPADFQHILATLEQFADS
jgi:23S rRNA pseudouridine1911/1915/1917 synthase